MADVFGPAWASEPEGEEYKKRQKALQTTITGAPQTATAFGGAERETFGALAGSKEVGAEQAQLAEALRAQAEGRAPSLAAMQYAQALEQSQAAAASQIASARGLSPAQAQRLMLTQQAGARAGAAAQSAQLRLQEQMAAQAALGNLLGQRRQQELLGGQLAAGLYGTAGGLGTQQALAQAQLDQRSKELLQQAAAAERAGNAQLASALIGAAGAGVGIAMGGSKGGGGGSAEGLKSLQSQVAALQAAQMTGAGQQGPPSALAPMQARGGLAGHQVPGKAKYKGDTRSNDTVPALLSPGEIVLPRSVAQDEDAPDKAKKFVAAIKKQKRPSPKAFAQALARLNELEARLNAMEALADLESEQEG